MKILAIAKESLATDFTWIRARRLAKAGIHAFPGAAATYAIEKVPIIGWLPRYNPRWLVNDVIAGLTLGLMLIPQGLSYARIATVPVQYGLMASWLPSTIYAFMGTTKGPTSLISLLTAEIIEELLGDSWSASEIASAVAMMIGIYGLAIGLFKLGFLLELISRPILSGFVSAVAIMIILNQMDSLLGEPSVGGGAAAQIRTMFRNLPQVNGYACAIGLTGVFLLTVLDQSGKKWGGKHKLVWFLSITRAFIALLIFTGVGYAVNKPRGSPDRFLFPVVQVEASGLETPRVPQAKLLSRVASGSITVFIGSAVEHTAIARGFGARNNYEADQSQELTFYGVANIANSFFHAVGVGGAMSRTAVNSSCHVKSPLSGLVTTAVVLVSIFKLVGTLYWIPKATLAAIIVTAVWPLISAPSVFYRYWRTSLADFISSMIAFWVSLFVSTSMGIAGSVGFNLAYILLRQVFTRVSVISDHRSELAVALDEARNIPATIPPDTRIFRFNDSLLFLNGYRVKTSVLEVIKTFHAPGSVVSRPKRTWSVTAEKRLEQLRHSAGITDSDTLPRLELVVLDFGKVNHIDTTALVHLRALIDECRGYSGEQVAFCFAGMSEYVTHRFERAGWDIDGKALGAVRAFDNVLSALAMSRKSEVGEEGGEIQERKGVKYLEEV